MEIYEHIPEHSKYFKSVLNIIWGCHAQFTLNSYFIVKSKNLSLN